MTKPLVLKALGVSVALLVITAGIVYFAQTPARTTLLTAEVGTARSPAISLSPSPAETVSIELKETPVVRLQETAAASKAPPAALSVTVTNVAFTCEGWGTYGPKVKLTATVTVPRQTSVTIRTNMELWPAGMKASIFLPSVAKSETFTIEGAVVPMVINWSVEAGMPAEWSKTMPPQNNPC